MNETTRQLIQQLHDSPCQIMMVTAGAGTQALSDLLTVAGASRTLLEAVVPYSKTAFDEFLGQTPDKYVSEIAVKLLAGRAFTRARWLERENHPVIGLACTATIITDRPKRGEHRAHIATWQVERLVCYSLHLQKGARNRSGEESFVSEMMLNALAAAYGLEARLPLTTFPGDELVTEVTDFAHMAHQLHHRHITHFGILDNGRILPSTTPAPPLMLSGAFNPLHDGHLQLAQTAADFLGHSVVFELAAVNVDKPPLPPDMMLQRMAQFAGRWPVYASTAPTYVEKARLYPGTTFVVGYDTAERILQPRYYQNSHEQLLVALAEIREMGCQFLVAGRVDENGRFRHIHHLDIPEPFTSLFQPIPAEKFRHDISSTELRLAGRRGSR